MREYVPEKMIMSLFDGILSPLSLPILDRGTLVSCFTTSLTTMEPFWWRNDLGSDTRREGILALL